MKSTENGVKVVMGFVSNEINGETIPSPTNEKSAVLETYVREESNYEDKKAARKNKK